MQSNTMDSFRPPENPNPYGPPAPPRSDPPSQRGYRGGNRVRQQRSWNQRSNAGGNNNNNNVGNNNNNGVGNVRGGRRGNFYERRSRDKSQDSGWRSRQYNERNLRSYRDGGSTYRDGSYCREGAASRDRRDSWGHRHYNDRSSRYGRDNNNGPSRNRQQERQPPWHQDRYHQQYQHQNGIAQNNWNSTSLAGSSGPHGHHGPHPPVSHGPTMIPVPGQHAPGLSPQLGPPGVSGHVNLHGSHVPPGPPGQIGQQAQHNQNQSGHLGHLGQHEHHERQPAQLVQPGAPGTHPVLPHYEQTTYQEPAPFQGQLPPQIPTWDQNYHPQPPGHHYQETYYHPYDHYQNQYNPYMNGADSMGYNHHMENKHAMPPQPPQPPQPPNPPHANIHMNVNNVQLTTQLRSPISPHTSYPQSSMPIQSIQPTHISQQPTVGTRSVKSHVSPIEVTPVTVKKCAELYEILSQVGEGTYGKVYKARNRETKEIVALKKIRMDPEKEKEAGFPLTAIREIKLLQQCKHKNVVQLKEIMVFQGFVYMVFEYMAHDLTGVLANPKLKYESQHVKCLMKQTLEGLAHLHENGILHRDIKGSNILLNNRGEVKLADFGLARQFDIKNKLDYTNRVITLWYRPPELCLGATEYSCEVDLWSVGCIMMELITGKPLFQGKDEFSQLDSIFNLMGVPDKKEWPEITDLSWYAMAKRNGPKGSKFREHFEHMLSPCALQLVESLLSVNPKKRPSALKALNYTYFTTESPHACSPSELPEILGDWHEYESKQKNKKANP